MNRRQFLRSTGAGVAGVMIGKSLFAQQQAAAPAVQTAPNAGPIGANNDIRVAVIGFKSHGKSHIRAYRNIPGVRIVALCDVDQQVLDAGVAELAKDNINVKAVRDMRRIFDDKEIDAVSMATPNFWHALGTVWACQAGKDVCVEKPASHSIWEGRKMVEAARKYNRMVQADLDSRSRVALYSAFDFVRSGAIGRIVYVRARDYKRRESIGKVSGPQRIPDPIDYDLWCGPTPMLPLMRRNLHYDWHWQWATGNGEISNNGAHSLDQVRWCIGKDGLPNRVLSFGGRYGYLDDGQVPNTQAAIYDYGGIPVIYECRGLPESSSSNNMDDLIAETADGKPLRIPHGRTAPSGGFVVFCEGGYCNGLAAYDNGGKEIKVFATGEGYQGPANAPTNVGGRGAQANFINACRTRKIEDLKTDVLQGHWSAGFCHMGNLSVLAGEAMTFEKARQQVASNPHAAKALDRMIQHLNANGVDTKTAPVTVGPNLTMDSSTERFTGPGSERANLFLKDSYREPFVIPEQV